MMQYEKIDDMPIVLIYGVIVICNWGFRVYIRIAWALSLGV